MTRRYIGVFSWPLLQMELSGQPHGRVGLAPNTHWMGGWWAPEAVWMTCAREIPFTAGNRTSTVLSVDILTEISRKYKTFWIGKKRNLEIKSRTAGLCSWCDPIYHVPETKSGARNMSRFRVLLLLPLLWTCRWQWATDVSARDTGSRRYENYEFRRLGG